MFPVSRRELTPVRLCSVRLSWRQRARPSTTLHEIQICPKANWNSSFVAQRRCRCKYCLLKNKMLFLRHRLHFIATPATPVWSTTLLFVEDISYAFSKGLRIKLCTDNLIRAIRQNGHQPIAYKSDRLLRSSSLDLRTKVLCTWDP
jgi:hypothetical protein